jgi:hypothetical protein
MLAPDECWFDHERWEVYQEAIALNASPSVPPEVRAKQRIKS